MVPPLVLRWPAHGGLLRVIAIPQVRANKLVSVEDAPSAPLRGEDRYPRKLMVSGLIEN